MTTNLTIRKATPQDTPVIHGLIRGLAEYEKRPQDMTATVEQQQAESILKTFL